MKTMPRISLRSPISSFAINLFWSLACVAAAASTPLPIVYQPLVPGTVAPGSAGFTLTVNGTGFVSGAVVYWNGNSRATTFVSSSRLMATISAADVASPTTASVKVRNPGQTASSNVVFLSVTDPLPTFVVSQVDYPLTDGSQVVNAVVAGDFNGDGKMDLAALSENPFGSDSVFILLGNGDGTLRPPVQYTLGVQSLHLVSGDFNGDGILDLAATNEGDGSVSILLGNGDGTFRLEPALAVGANPRHLVVGDFNGDGKLDLGVATETDVAILLGNGDGTFQAPINTSEPDGPFSITAADFNQDGKLDVALGTLDNNGTGNTVTVYLGKGDGTFQPATHFSLPYYYGFDLKAADLNGDGKLDLAVAGTFLAVLIGNGDGTFQPGIDYGSESLMGTVAFGDFNGDGKLDVIGEASYRPILYLGNGDGTFQNQIPLGTFFQSEDAAPADMNGDGAMDMAVAEGSYTGNLDLLLQGTFTLTPNILFNPKNLAFGNVRVGHTATRSVTMTNSGTAPFTPTISFRGSGNSQFSQTSTCPATVYPRGTCIIRVAFTPTSTETLRVQLVATDNSTGYKQTLLINAAGSQ
jgi:hypothetical protein